MNTTFNLWLNSKPRVDGTFEIFIRVTQDRKHKSVKTGITVASKTEFNKKAKYGQWIRGKSGSIKNLNNILENKLNELKDKYHKLDSAENNPSKERLINLFKGEAPGDFMIFLNRIIERFSNAGSYRSAKRYNQLRNKLISFSGSNLPFDRLTVTFMKDFQDSLTGLHQNTIYEHFKNLKAAVNQAINEDVFSSDKNPFIRFKVDQVTTSKERLTEKEIKAIQNAKIKKDDPLWHIRNYFLFSFYAGGIRAGDLMTLKWDNVQDGNLTYVMSKTVKKKLISKSIPILPEAEKILNIYNSKNEKDEFIFPILNPSLANKINSDKRIKSGEEVKFFNAISSRNADINKKLKALADLAGIAKKLTFHIARHSFADYAINKGINPKALQKILGHEKFATTETYINSIQNKLVDDEMRKLFA